MTELRTRIPESTLKTLARRTARLLEQIDRATQGARDKAVREGGAQLAELLGERLDELRDLVAMEDDDAGERVRAFALRLRLAEAKVAAWPGARPEAPAHDRRPAPRVRPLSGAAPAGPTKPRGPHGHKPSRPTKSAA